MHQGAAANYEQPFEYIVEHVRPKRVLNSRESYRRLWWQHVEARPAFRGAVATLSRFLCTTRVSKHRLFVWKLLPTLPDSAVFAFARDDDDFMGVVHSRAHEIWARSQGTQLRERESGFRYTPNSCFETFPFPEPTEEQREAIAAAARELNALREAWLNPPEWTRTEVLEFSGSAGGPWRRYIDVETVTGDIGTVKYPRLVPRDEECAKLLKKRTLTNLYNERPTWLDLAHARLDEAVFTAYGWDPTMSDHELLAAILELNVERS